jgi:hypothetical protein
MRRDPAEDFDILPYRIIIHSEGMYFISRIRIHISRSANFRLWPLGAVPLDRVKAAIELSDNVVLDGS